MIVFMLRNDSFLTAYKELPLKQWEEVTVWKDVQAETTEMIQSSVQILQTLHRQKYNEYAVFD